jgi:hypothetical protein
VLRIQVNGKGWNTEEAILQAKCRNQIQHGEGERKKGMGGKERRGGRFRVRGNTSEVIIRADDSLESTKVVPAEEPCLWAKT